MDDFTSLFKSGDWKSEKHVPTIEVLDKPETDRPLRVTVTVGKEMPHPNKTEHHIAMMELYFLPDKEKNPYLLGRFELGAHGASVDGPDQSSIFTIPTINCTFKSGKSGTLFATSYCNIHGLWKSAVPLKF